MCYEKRSQAEERNGEIYIYNNGTHKEVERKRIDNEEQERVPVEQISFLGKKIEAMKLMMQRMIQREELTGRFLH